MLTGMPLKKHWIRGKPAEEVWEVARDGAEKGYIMSSSCTVRGKWNLVGYHAYSLLGVKVLKRADGGEHKLLKVRNPWGNEKFTGKWSDEDNESWD